MFMYMYFATPLTEIPLNKSLELCGKINSQCVNSNKNRNACPTVCQYSARCSSFFSVCVCIFCKYTLKFYMG